MDLLHFGHCPYLEVDSTVCRLSEYFYADIWCDWISKSSQDKNIVCYRILNGSQDTDTCVSGHQTNHRTDHKTIGQITGYSGQTLLSVIVARSDWFHYCIIVWTVESIPVDCNLYF